MYIYKGYQGFCVCGETLLNFGQLNLSSKRFQEQKKEKRKKKSEPIIIISSNVYINEINQNVP